MYSARRVLRRNPATDLPQVKRKCESPLDVFGHTALGAQAGAGRYPGPSSLETYVIPALEAWSANTAGPDEAHKHGVVLSILGYVIPRSGDVSGDFVPEGDLPGETSCSARMRTSLRDVR